MTGHTATTLAYVRTEAGVVKVLAGEHVPQDALPGEVARLCAAGALVEATADSGQAAGGDAPDGGASGEPPKKTPPKRRSRASTQES